MTDVIKSFTEEHFFLSNFYPEKDGKTGEHYYQAAKTTDPDESDKIFYAATPGLAKRLGRAVKVREDWDEVKDDVMYRVIRGKFGTDEALKAQLLATGDALLQEGNDWDDLYWGVDLKTGKGENKLGQILMKVREELRVEAEPAPAPAPVPEPEEETDGPE